MTDPHWTTLFAIAGGVVTHRGGSFCHSAVVACEYKLPAIVGGQRAMQTIEHGQRIEVNGAITGCGY